MVERALAVFMTVAAAVIGGALLSPHLVNLWEGMV